MIKVAVHLETDNSVEVQKEAGGGYVESFRPLKLRLVYEKEQDGDTSFLEVRIPYLEKNEYSRKTIDDYDNKIKEGYAVTFINLVSELKRLGPDPEYIGHFGSANSHDIDLTVVYNDHIPDPLKNDMAVFQDDKSPMKIDPTVIAIADGRIVEINNTPTKFSIPIQDIANCINKTVPELKDKIQYKSLYLEEKYKQALAYFTMDREGLDPWQSLLHFKRCLFVGIQYLAMLEGKNAGYTKVDVENWARINIYNSSIFDYINLNKEDLDKIVFNEVKYRGYPGHHYPKELVPASQKEVSDRLESLFKSTAFVFLEEVIKNKKDPIKKGYFYRREVSHSPPVMYYLQYESLNLDNSEAVERGCLVCKKQTGDKPYPFYGDNDEWWVGMAETGFLCENDKAIVQNNPEF